jgi:hypothetical protein
MPRPRKGYVEPRRRANGALYFLARIWLADGSRERVKVPLAYCKPAGGRTARERAELDGRGPLWDDRRAVPAPTECASEQPAQPTRTDTS